MKTECNLISMKNCMTRQIFYAFNFVVLHFIPIMLKSNIYLFLLSKIDLQKNMYIHLRVLLYMTFYFVKMHSRYTFLHF